MKGIPTKINMFNLYRDGSKQFGTGDEVTLPDFEAMTETLSGPGILGEVECPTVGHYGSQEMEIPFRVMNDEMFSMVTPGSTITLRSSIQNDGSDGIEYTGLRVVIRGMVKSLSSGKVKQGSPTDSKVKLEVTYILIELDGKPKIELDKFNSVYKVNGVDLLEKARALC